MVEFSAFVAFKEVFVLDDGIFVDIFTDVFNELDELDEFIKLVTFVTLVAFT